MVLTLAVTAYVLSIKKRSYLAAGVLSAVGIMGTIHILSFLGDFNYVMFPGPIVALVLRRVVLVLGIAKGIERYTDGSINGVTCVPNGRAQHVG